MVAPRPSSGIPRRSAGIALSAASVVLTLLTFPPFGLWPLAFVALVPAGICTLRRPASAFWTLVHYLAGFVFFIAGLFWMWRVNFWGTLALSLYCGIYFAIFALLLGRLVNSLRVPATLATPLALVTVEFVRATFIEGGFAWFLLGTASARPNSGWHNSVSEALLQCVDLFGVWGVSFLVATVNGFILDGLRLPLIQPGAKRASRLLLGLGAYVAALLVAAVLYGTWRLHQATITTGPKIGVVQPDWPQRLKDDPNRAAEMFQEHLTLTEQLIAREHPVMVVWPETMVPYAINEEVLALNPNQLEPKAAAYVRRSREAYRRLTEIADRTQTHLLVGVSFQDPFAEPGSDMSNTAVLIAPGKGQVERYAKVHLVPFGEYIPFAPRGTWLRKFLLNLTPLKYDYSLKAGTQWTRFEFTIRDAVGRPQTYAFGTPICFEDVMPGPAREMVRPSHGRKRVDFLINISNDGWFYAAELDQHLQACQVRAVENRVPIVRSVNRGNSGMIDSCGRIVGLVRDAEGNSIHTTGFGAWTLPLDSRVALYSQIGDVFPIACGIVTVLLVGWTLVRPRRGRAVR